MFHWNCLKSLQKNKDNDILVLYEKFTTEMEKAMEERRRNKRIELQSKIMLKALNGEEPQEISIEVLDASKSGLGFRCNEKLEIGTIYESYLTLWTKEVIHAFLQIARIELKDQEYDYGAVFIGMPDMDTSKIEIYRVVSESEE